MPGEKFPQSGDPRVRKVEYRESQPAWKRSLTASSARQAEHASTRADHMAASTETERMPVSGRARARPARGIGEHAKSPPEQPGPASPETTGRRTSWSEETGTDLTAELQSQRWEAIRAAREALDNAERDAKRLQKLEAHSAEAAVSAEQLSWVLQELGKWRLWAALLQKPELNSNIEAWRAADDFARIVENMQPDEVGSGSIEPLLAAIARLRKQIEFVDQHARSHGWLEVAEIYHGAAQRIRWKVAVALAAAMADTGAGGGSLTAKIMLAALTGAGAGSLATAVLDEIRDRASVRSMASTPRGRVCKAQEELVRPIDVLITLLDRRARHIHLEEGELEVMRTAHLVAEFRAINLGQSLAGFGWIKRPLYMEAFKRLRESLDDVLYITVSRKYGRADRILAQVDGAVDGLKVYAPPEN